MHVSGWCDLPWIFAGTTMWVSRFSLAVLLLSAAGESALRLASVRHTNIKYGISLLVWSASVAPDLKHLVLSSDSGGVLWNLVTKKCSGQQKMDYECFTLAEIHIIIVPFWPIMLGCSKPRSSKSCIWKVFWSVLSISPQQTKTSTNPESSLISCFT